MKFIITSLFFLGSFTLANDKTNKPIKLLEAKISGDTYLGDIGKTADIRLGSSSCQIKTSGTKGGEGEAPKVFRIEFVCQKGIQVLWDIAKPFADDFAFDDPKFSILWAGDRDGDGKIDIEMDMSPKYSCSKEVLYLSSKAKKGELLGISGSPKTTCGE